MRLHQLFAQATVPMPAKVIDTEPNKCSAAAPHALTDRPCSKSATISEEKVENVVKPPQKPVITNSRHSGASPEEEAKNATATPMMKKVVHHKVVHHVVKKPMMVKKPMVKHHVVHHHMVKKPMAKKPMPMPTPTPTKS